VSSSVFTLFVRMDEDCRQPRLKFSEMCIITHPSLRGKGDPLRDFGSSSLSVILSFLLHWAFASTSAVKREPHSAPPPKLLRETSGSS